MLKPIAPKLGSILIFALAALLASCGPGEIRGPAHEQESGRPSPERELGPSDDATAADVDASVSARDAEGLDASSAPVPQSAEATAILALLRERFVVKVPTEPTETDPSEERSDASLAAPVTKPLLEVSVADGFESGPVGIVPHFPRTGAAPSPARVQLSQKAKSPFRIEDATTGAAVEVTLLEGRDTAAQAAEGYIVYPHGHASGATILHRALPEGTEDYFSFDQRPEQPVLSYEVKLAKGVSGLRLVANSLEMVDGKGAPRLRVSPPTLMGGDGAVIEATLTVEGCAVDTDPRPPWGRSIVAPGSDSCRVTLTWQDASVAYPALLDPKWSTTGSMATVRQGHTSTLLSNGLVLVTGGSSNGSAGLATAELYDRTTGTWAGTGSMTGTEAPRWRHTACQLATSSNTTTSGKVLIAGGLNGSSSTSTTQLYSPTAGTFIAGADMGTPRNSHTATVLANGGVLVTGGMGGTTVFNTATVFTPAASGTGTWNATPNMASKRRSHTATLLTTSNATLNNKVLVVGGNSGSTTSVTSVQLFDPSNTSWSTLTALSTAREGQTATVMSDGKVLFTGGKSGTATLDTALLFNPATGSGTWAAAGTMTTARQLHTATLLSTSIVNSGRVVVAGGSSDGTTSLTSAELFDGTSTWTATTALAAATHAHTATLLGNGLVLIAGGLNGSTTVSASELYDPSSGIACTSASQCSSGFCANGVCCNNACTSECSACNLAGLQGTCSPKTSGTACTDDGNVCTVDQCDGANVTCQHPAGNAGVTCRNGNGLCDPAEACTGSSTTCPTDVQAPVGTSCSDGNACNGAETCAAGICVAGTPPNQDDGNPCTTASCDPATGVITQTPNEGASCSDGNACNGADTCDANGACIPVGPPLDPNDGNPCTTDTCNPATGVISHTPAAGPGCTEQGGAITFYMPYESTVAAPQIAGGSPVPNGSDSIQLATGLFGQAEKSETLNISWPKAGNIDLSRPGSVSFWIKPNQWTAVNWIFIVYDGERKFLVYSRDGALFSRMEHNGGAQEAIEAPRADIPNWGTDTNWHLVVATWGSDYVGLSLDGAPTQTASATWLAAVPGGPSGLLFAGGDNNQGYLLDELMVFNRTLWDNDIAWMSGTRSAPTSPNPAIAKFGTTPIASTQGAITFYMPYGDPVPSIAGGSPAPLNTDQMVLAPGLFGQAAKAESKGIAWSPAGNIHLSRPGSVSFWLKPDQWTAVNWIFIVYDGERKFMVYSRDGALYSRMEHNGGAQESVEVPQGFDVSNWGTDTNWHLVVATWGPDYVGLSLDGAPTQMASASWLPAYPGGGTGGLLIAGGQDYAGFLRDELIVFNRTLWDGEIAWMWGTRTTPSAWNPAIAKFGTSPSTTTQGAITFYMPYEGAGSMASIAGGSPAATTSDPITPAPGLFGQAAKSETPPITWPKASNIDLSRAGSVSFWVKPDHWTAGNSLFGADDGQRKLTVYRRDGSLYSRMEHIGGGAEAVEVTQGDISTWSTTDNGWHLVVARWGSDYVGLSLDGAPTQTASATWLATIPGGAGGALDAGGDAQQGFLRDELLVFNRPVWDGEIAWMWGTRSTASAWNPAIARFGTSLSAPTQGSITFYMPYEGTGTVASIAGGSPAATTSDLIVQAPGLFGQAAKAETNYIPWHDEGNIDLSHAGSVSFWIKPDQWTSVNWMFIAYGGERKFMVYSRDGALYSRMEHNGGAQEFVEVTQGFDVSNWGTDNNWHLVVATWGQDYVGLSLDGAPTRTASASWLSAIPGDGGYFYAAGENYAGFLRDELIVFNRTVWDEEITWLWGTRLAPSAANPAIAKFGMSPIASTQGAITFYLPYQGTAAVAAIAGGSPTPTTIAPLVPAQGLFGDAAKSETPNIAWPDEGDIDLSRAGSVSFWMKPDQWTSVNWIFIVYGGERKFMVYSRDGALYSRMEHNGGAQESVEVTQGDISTWGTAPDSWHLVVATWGPDYVGLSLDGSPTRATSAPWLAAIPGAGGAFFADGQNYAGFLRDELIIFNRRLWDDEITWLWGTRTTPSWWNPAINKFGRKYCPSVPPTVIDDDNPCTTDSCDLSTGVVQHAPVPANTSCSDGNACNGAEVCDASHACVPGTPVNCAVADQCHDAGTCDPATGLCPNPRPNGAVCNDGSACTRGDVCQASLCTGTAVPGCGAKIPVEDLGTLVGGTRSNAWGINDAGVAVGWSWDAGGAYRIVRWRPGSAIEMLGPAYAGAAVGINSSGVVVGSIFGGSAFRYSDAAGFLMVSPQGLSEYGGAINELNSVVATSATQASRYTDAHGHQLLGILPGGNRSYAGAIDDQDNVVGWAAVATTPAGDQWNPGHAFRYNNATSQLQDLNVYAPIGWELRTARAVNGNEIVGFASHESMVHAYRLTLSPQRVDDLGTFEGGGISYPLGINKNGAVAGAAYLDGTGAGNNRAAVFTEQLGAVNLDNTVDPADGWVLVEATALNNNGDVVGWGFHNGNLHAFKMHVPGLNPARVPRCQNNAQCGTGFCSPQGVCCDTACTSVCSSCMNPGKVGTCSPRAAGSRCSAASICDTGGDVCDANGACVPGSGPIDTNDNNPCTIDTCDPSTGAKHAPNVGASCSDGNACNGAETCDANGACTAGLPVNCGVPDACHLAASCNPATGVCDYPPAPQGTSCGDGNPCNGIELCDGAGSCVTSGFPQTDDGNPCTADSCDPVSGVQHTPISAGTSCNSLCLTGGVGTCDAGGTCVGGTAVTCTAEDQCHGVGTCNPTTGECSSPPLSDGTVCDDGMSCTQGETCQGGTCVTSSHACTPECPCDTGSSCTGDQDCLAGLLCGEQNGRRFGKDPLSSNCWLPECPSDPYYGGCGQVSSGCGKCPPPPPRVCTGDTDCQNTNEVCGQGNGVAFGLGNVNVCWPPVCSGGQTFCGSPIAPCGNCSCTSSCGSKTCSTPDKSDSCVGYCAGLCGDGQNGCTSNLDCQNDSICYDGTCVPPVCTALDSSRGCPGAVASCATCPQCPSLCQSTGRQCGPDPAGCAAGCGTCGTGLTCVDGLCRPSANPDLPPTEATAPIGALEGSFSVTDSGQAQYSIPIALPPGRAGLQPTVGLVYTSDKKLGPEGVGWRLTGFSQIARCTTRVTGDAPQAIQWSRDDRLCLDGKRLVKIADGTYRTEVDQFSKIVVNTSEYDGNPLSFKLYTKAGTIFTYGDTADSSVFHVYNGPGHREFKRAWSVSRVEDRNGNSMRYTYEARRFHVDIPDGVTDILNGTSEMIPLEISYGANTAAGFENDRGIRFHYIDVGVRSKHYVNGDEVQLRQKLDNIETYARNGAIARRYHFDYEDRGNLFRLIGAHECAPDAGGPDVCKPPTVFTYNDGYQGTALDVNPIPLDNDHSKPLFNWTGKSADLDSDGDDDWWLRGGDVPATDLGQFTTDFENDGNLELLANSVTYDSATGKNVITVSNSSVHTYLFGPVTTPGGAARVVGSADIDGDGRKDVLVCAGLSMGYLNGATMLTTPEYHPLPNHGQCEASAARLVDVDDDGVLNWVRSNGGPNGSMYMLLNPNTGSGMWIPLLFDGDPATPYTAPNRAQLLDGNGDGLVDILANDVLWLNRGDGSFGRTKAVVPPPDPIADPSALVYDFDGDGNDDYVMGDKWIHWTFPNVASQISTGPYSPLIRFNLEDIPGPPDVHFGAFFADVNGDGDLDLIEGQGTVGGYCSGPRPKCKPQVRLGHSRRMNLLESVVDGVGRKIDISYDGRATQIGRGCSGQSDLLCPSKFPPLVSEHRVSIVAPQGVDPNPRRFFAYGYSEARAGTNGRGSYGFGGRTIEEYEGVEGQTARGNLVSTTDIRFYNTDFVRAGLVQERTVTMGATDGVAGLIKPSRRMVGEVNDYQPVTKTAGVSYPALKQSKVIRYDWPVGEVAPLAVSSEVSDFTTGDINQDYDEWGNSKYKQRRSYVGLPGPDAVSTTTTNRTFKVDTDKWLVGLLETQTVTDVRGNATETRNWGYQYDDASGRLTLRTRDPGGAFQQVEEFRYEDAVHNLTAHIVNPGQLQRATSIAYDDATLIFPYDTRNALNHRVLTDIDPRNGAVVKTTDPNGLIETRTYDAFGRLRKVQGPSGTMHMTLMSGATGPSDVPASDSRAVMRVLTEELSTTGALVGARKMEDFGARGEILQRETTGYQTPSGADQWVEETFTYDHVGRLLRQSRPHLAQINDQGDIQFFYDNTGHLYEERYPGATGTTSVFHANATQQSWLGGSDEFSFSAVELGLTSKRVMTSDGIASALSNAPARIVDPEGLTIATRDPATFTDYAYGPFRQLTWVEVGRDQGIQTSIEYDPYGRKKRHSDPDTGVETYDFYNTFDELEVMTDARGVTRKYFYDDLGRMTTALAFVNGLPVADEKTTWEYDTVLGEPAQDNEIGRLVRVSTGDDADPNRHRTRYHYQSGAFGLLDGVERKIADDTFVTSFSYENDFNRPAGVQYPTQGGSFAVGRCYDQRGNLTAVSDTTASGLPCDAPAYWKVNTTSQGYRIETEQFGNNAVTTSTYDPFTGRLARIKTDSDASQQPAHLQDFNYTYTPNGNLESRNNVVHGSAETFIYDELDRLTHIGQNGQPATQAAWYDFRGRIMTKANVGTYDYSFPSGVPAPVHAPHAIVNGGSTRAFSYDASGNEIGRIGGPEGTRTTEYNSFNLPLSISDTASQSTTTFEYDGDHARVIKRENATRTTVYAGNLYERITDTSGGTPVITHKYRVFAEGKQIAQIERTPGTPDDRTLYFHGDHLGSTQLVTNGTPSSSSEFIVGEQTFDPWGKVEGTPIWALASASNVHTGFTGHEHDPEHSLINMRGRIYDPELGRFTTADPIVQAPFYSQSLNRYAYVFNNPLKYTDPSGFDPAAPGAEGDPAARPIPPGGTETTIGPNGEITITAYITGTAPSERGATPDGPTPGTEPYDTGPSQEGARARAESDTDRSSRGQNERPERGWRDTAVKVGRDVGMGIAKELAKPIFYGAAAFAAAEWQFDIAQDFINAVEPENDTEELAGAIFVLILGGPEAEEAVGGGGPAGKQPRFNGPKPRYAENPVHIPGRGLRPGKTPLPPDAEAVFSRAVPNAPSNPTAWFGKNSEGSIYRFSSSNDGSAHFSGIEGVGDGTRNLTPYAKDRLNGQ